MSEQRERVVRVILTEAEVDVLTKAMDAVSTFFEQRRWKKDTAREVDALNDALGLQSYRLKRKLGDVKQPLP